MALFDAHNHLHHPSLENRLGEILKDLASIHLAGAAVNGTHQKDWANVDFVASKGNWIRPQYGIHPWFVGNRTQGWSEALRKYLRAGAGLGEVGLDRWMLERCPPNDSRLLGLRRASMKEQIEVFQEQLSFAVEFNAPVTIHCLDAWDDLIAVLNSVKLPPKGFLLHAYSGPEEQIFRLASLGAYFSFNGYFLLARPTHRALAFKRVPIDRLLVETDAPSLAAQKEFRRFQLPKDPDGETLNHPANLAVSYEGLAAIVDMPLNRLVPIVATNFKRLFENE